jgi:hypothetical protein
MLALRVEGTLKSKPFLVASDEDAGTIVQAEVLIETVVGVPTVEIETSVEFTESAEALSWVSVSGPVTATEEARSCVSVTGPVTATEEALSSVLVSPPLVTDPVTVTVDPVTSKRGKYPANATDPAKEARTNTTALFSIIFSYLNSKCLT